MKDPSTSESSWSDPDPESSDPGDPDLQQSRTDEEQTQESSTDDTGSSNLNADPDDPEAGIHDLTRIANNIVDVCPEILDLTREHSADSSAQQGETSRMIGPYKILDFIARGGFGDVYLCQETCKPHRKLAVKVIRAGLDTKDVLARFEAEKNALRLMNHAAISRIIDSGATEDDHPYFAMEYIQGQTLTEFCSKEQLTLEERLRLFIDICSGVQHAHAKSVIHRDLKPSNIMVTRIDGVTRAKIIDFGLVKSLQQPLCDQTLHTRNGALVGTYEYMSPEQARSEGAEIDTRSDIYALGAILYQLLTGEMPLGGLRKCSYAEALDRISREEPIRPSLRIRSDVESATSDHASTLKIGTEQLTQRLEVDLDWVVMKALEKEPERRYQTVQEFARDIENFLSGEMVEARPPSTSYRLNKFARRNRVVLTATALVFLSLSGVSGWALTEQSKANAATITTKERANELELTLEVLEEGSTFDESAVGQMAKEKLQAGYRKALKLDGVEGEGLKSKSADFESRLSSIDWTTFAKTLLVETYFEPALERIDRNYGAQPVFSARLKETITRHLIGNGMYNSARPVLENVLEIRREHLGNLHLDTLHTCNSMGALLQRQGKLDDAMPYYMEALEGCRLTLGNDDPDTLNAVNNMGTLLRAQGKLAEAMPFYREALEGRRRVLGNDDRDTLTSVNNMGVLLWNQGELDEAMSFYKEALEGRRRVLGNDHRDTLTSLNNMGVLLRRQKKLDEAMPFCKEALEGRRRVLGNDHPDTLTSVNNMGTLLRAQRKLDEALPFYKEALEGRRRMLGNDHRDTLNSIYSMGVLARDLGRLEEAESLSAEAVKGARRKFTDGHDNLGIFLSGYVKALVAMKRFEDARNPALEAYSILVAKRGVGHKRTQKAMTNFVDLYNGWHKTEPEAGHDKSAAEWQAKLDALTVAPTAK
jgi:serine/threonine protein kinase/tetratricopeptide (TPR) repeat protein